jgi:hypothetical protein
MYCNSLQLRAEKPAQYLDCRHCAERMDLQNYREEIEKKKKRMKQPLMKFRRTFTKK